MNSPINGEEFCPEKSDVGIGTSASKNAQAQDTTALWGWITSGPESANKSIATVQPELTAEITANCKTLSNTIGSITTAGDIKQTEDGSIIAIVGTPHWKTDELSGNSYKYGDASALASAYALHNEKFLEHVGGTFSFAILDSARKVLLTGIDRIGQHTLYYSKQAGKLIFGSTASTTLSQAGKTGTPTEQGIYNYVYFHMIPSPNSVYGGLHKLPAAHYLRSIADNTQVQRYWSPDFQKKSPHSFSDLGKELKQQLRNAVERSLKDTESVGTFLSGGLDSSTVTGMLAEITDSSRPAYAIGFNQEGYDEMEYARSAAKHFGVTLQEYYVTPQDVVDELSTIATSYDEPFGNSSALPAYFCGKKAAEDGIDYLLAGDGGDEIFAGNERYSKQKIFSVYEKIPAALRSFLIEPTITAMPAALPLRNKIKSYIKQAKTPLPDRLQSYNYLNRMSPKDIFSDKFLDAVDTEQPIQLLRNTYWSLDDSSELCRMLYLDWQYTLADNDLRKVNRMCSLAGIGVRYPMLDDGLLEFSCKVPDSWKLKPGKLRHFYKESLQGWLPDVTINKKKQGFGLPFGLWMRDYKPLREMAHDSILRLKGRGYFKKEFLDQLIKLHREEHAAYYGELIWVLTVFDLWLEGRKVSTL